MPVQRARQLCIGRQHVVDRDEIPRCGVEGLRAQAEKPTGAERKNGHHRFRREDLLQHRGTVPYAQRRRERPGDETADQARADQEPPEDRVHLVLGMRERRKQCQPADAVGMVEGENE